MFQVERATPADLAPIRQLLEAAGLPTSDLETARPEFLVIHGNGAVLAAGALQRFGSSALVRSVVVAEAQRARGLGQQLIAELERVAAHSGIAQLVLLTQTADSFFAREGYRKIERSEAPPLVQDSSEFRSLCPGTATCMVKALVRSR